MKFGLRGLAALALATAISFGAATPGLSQSGGYYGQRATQDRDYSRLHAATNRAYGGKTEKVTIGKKKKKKHAHKHKHKMHKHTTHKHAVPKPKAHKH